MVIEVVGFDNSRAISDAAVRDFVSRTFSLVFLRKLSRIAYVDIYKSTQHDRDGFDSIFTMGLYVASAHWKDDATGLDIVEVYRHDPVEPNREAFVLHCISHEIGHSVYETLPSSTRQEWQSISAATTTRELMTQRSAVNAVEDFCETFALYHLDRARVSTSSPSKLQFMNILSITPDLSTPH